MSGTNNFPYHPFENKSLIIYPNGILTGPHKIPRTVPIEIQRTDDIRSRNRLATDSYPFA